MDSSPVFSLCSPTKPLRIECGAGAMLSSVLGFTGIHEVRKGVSRHTPCECCTGERSKPKGRLLVIALRSVSGLAVVGSLFRCGDWKMPSELRTLQTYELLTPSGTIPKQQAGLEREGTKPQSPSTCSILVGNSTPLHTSLTLAEGKQLAKVKQQNYQRLRPSLCSY